MLFYGFSDHLNLSQFVQDVSNSLNNASFMTYSLPKNANFSESDAEFINIVPKLTLKYFFA